ncbi:hypothetical protein JOC70_000699 [Clostridium pascui]|uniref:hypothetical protein n=1 Tax=Clostridium pascui TaxID=46609 RepID=UPI001958BB77|nr:hypothetical protein [Clostridium pascui]MBM7869230.1 hypothetical protein [Clostridium pascui]
MAKKETKEVNTKKNFFTELSHKFSKPFQKKYYYYFLWKNKLSNSETDFSAISEEEFINKYLRKKRNGKTTEGKKSYKSLQMWESTDQYQGLMQEYYNFKMNRDFYKLYETYLEKAMSGDEKALDALKTIKKEIESLNKVQKTSNKPSENEGAKFDLT